MNHTIYTKEPEMMDYSIPLPKEPEHDTEIDHDLEMMCDTLVASAVELADFDRQDAYTLVKTALENSNEVHLDRAKFAYNLAPQGEEKNYILNEHFIPSFLETYGTEEAQMQELFCMANQLSVQGNTRDAFSLYEAVSLFAQEAQTKIDAFEAAYDTASTQADRLGIVMQGIKEGIWAPEAHDFEMKYN